MESTDRTKIAKHLLAHPEATPHEISLATGLHVEYVIATYPELSSPASGDPNYLAHHSEIIIAHRRHLLLTMMGMRLEGKPLAAISAATGYGIAACRARVGPIMADRRHGWTEYKRGCRCHDCRLAALEVSRRQTAKRKGASR